MCLVYRAVWREPIYPRNAFRGRVTEYLSRSFQAGAYDFYLCGRSEMVRDVTFLVDELFPGSHVYSEVFQ